MTAAQLLESRLSLGQVLIDDTKLVVGQQDLKQHLGLNSVANYGLSSSVHTDSTVVGVEVALWIVPFAGYTCGDSHCCCFLPLHQRVRVLLSRRYISGVVSVSFPHSLHCKKWVGFGV